MRGYSLASASMSFRLRLRWCGGTAHRSPSVSVALGVKKWETQVTSYMAAKGPRVWIVNRYFKKYMLQRARSSSGEALREQSRSGDGSGPENSARPPRNQYTLPTRTATILSIEVTMLLILCSVNDSLVYVHFVNTHIIAFVWVSLRSSARTPFCYMFCEKC